MNGGVLPLILLFATVGLALGAASPRTAWLSLAVMVGTGLPVSLQPVPPSASDAVFTGLWVSAIATAVLAFLPGRLIDRLALPAALNAGLWSGALASMSDQRAGLVLALILALLAVPARWLALRGHRIVIKVAASWMIAIASLSMFVSFLPTPGYKLDHME